jgi:hypothetical protein
MDAQELRKQIKIYLTPGNNLRRPLVIAELNDLKDNLNKLRAILNDDEWKQQIGRRHDCFISEVDRILSIYAKGGNPYPEFLNPAPKPEPVKPVVEPVKPEEKPTPEPAKPPTPEELWTQ